MYDIFLLCFWSTALLAVRYQYTSIRVPRRELLAFDQRGWPMLDFCELRNIICQVFYRTPCIDYTHELTPRVFGVVLIATTEDCCSVVMLVALGPGAWSRRQGVFRFVWFPRTIPNDGTEALWLLCGLIPLCYGSLNVCVGLDEASCVGGGSSPVDILSALELSRPRCLQRGSIVSWK